MNAKPTLTLIPALLAALLAGCTTDPDDPAGPKGPLVDSSLSAIKGAMSIAAADGRLYVANREAAAMGVAVVDLASGKVIAFHKSTLPPNQMVIAGDSVLVVTGTDYTTGALSRLGLKTGRWTPEYRTVGSDHVLTAAGDKVFLMERSSDVVTGFTGGRLEDANVFLNVNTGSKSNPYQAALHGNTAFVTRYGSAHLLVLDAGSKDGGARDSIDLSAWAPDSLKGTPGAVPGMDAVVAHGGKLFVTVQRLTAYKAKDTSKVLIIDPAAKKVTGEIALQYRNPFSVSTRGKWLFVACVETHGTFTGAIERIDMEKAAHAGIVVKEADLVPPSDIAQFLPIADDKGYAVHSPDYKSGYVSPVTIP